MKLVLRMLLLLQPRRSVALRLARPQIQKDADWGITGGCTYFTLLSASYSDLSPLFPGLCLTQSTTFQSCLPSWTARQPTYQLSNFVGYHHLTKDIFDSNLPEVGHDFIQHMVANLFGTPGTSSFFFSHTGHIPPMWLPTSYSTHLSFIVKTWAYYSPSAHAVGRDVRHSSHCAEMSDFSPCSVQRCPPQFSLCRDVRRQSLQCRDVRRGSRYDGGGQRFCGEAQGG